LTCSYYRVFYRVSQISSWLLPAAQTSIWYQKDKNIIMVYNNRCWKPVLPRSQPLVIGRQEGRGDVDVHEPTCHEHVTTGRRAVIHPAAAKSPLAPAVPHKQRRLTTTTIPVLARYNRFMFLSLPPPSRPRISEFVGFFFLYYFMMFQWTQTHTHTHIIIIIVKTNIRNKKSLIFVRPRTILLGTISIYFCGGWTKYYDKNKPAGPWQYFCAAFHKIDMIRIHCH